MLSYRSNPVMAVGLDRVVRLSKRDLKTLRIYSQMERWPAAYLKSGHLDNCLVELGYLKVEQIDGEGKFVSITATGRAALSNGGHQSEAT